MTERPSSKDFEQHPDVRTLQGGPHHEVMQSKLDLLLDAPVLTRIADVPVDNTLRIRSYLRAGTGSMHNHRFLNMGIALFP